MRLVFRDDVDGCIICNECDTNASLLEIKNIDSRTTLHGK
jgi:hypothetical protein